jgi:RNA polymerase sigma-70 factor (ECF subfamily)
MDFIETHLTPLRTKMPSRRCAVTDEEPFDTPDMLERLRKCDAQAFSLLVERHEPLIRGMAQSMGFRGADMDDAAAEVFAEVYLALANFAARSQLRTWIYTIAFRTLSKQRALLARKASAANVMEAEESATTQATLAPVELAARSELHQRLWAAVARLDAKSAAAIELRYRQGLSMDRIAQVLECPSGTVKTLLFRAREQLRIALERHVMEVDQ